MLNDAEVEMEKHIVYRAYFAGSAWNQYLFRSKYSLGLSEYEICSNRIVSDIRIVQLTDLHNSTFGDNNADLIALVQEQNPDLILITGDQLNSGEENTSIATDSISALCQISYGLCIPWQPRGRISAKL